MSMSQADLAKLAALILSMAQPAKKPGNLGVKSKKFPKYAPKLSPAVTVKTKTDGKTVQLDPKIKYEIAVTKGMAAKGFANIKLRDTGTNGVLTYKRWLAAGRVVKKGETGVKGCFHYSQTMPNTVTEADLLAAVAEHRNAA